MERAADENADHAAAVVGGAAQIRDGIGAGRVGSGDSLDRGRIGGLANRLGKDVGYAIGSIGNGADDNLDLVKVSTLVQRDDRGDANAWPVFVGARPVLEIDGVCAIGQGWNGDLEQ